MRIDRVQGILQALQGSDRELDWCKAYPHVELVELKRRCTNHAGSLIPSAIAYRPLQNLVLLRGYALIPLFGLDSQPPSQVGLKAENCGAEELGVILRPG